MLENSQHDFYALDMNDGINPMRKGEINNLLEDKDFRYIEKISHYQLLKKSVMKSLPYQFILI